MLIMTLPGSNSVVYEARWHPRQPGLIASTSSDGFLRLYDLKQSSPIIKSLAHPTEILCLDWSKYDDHLLVTGSCDNCLRLWDIRMTTECIAILSGHEAAVRRTKFDPHRRDRLASTGYDGQVKLWKITTNQTRPFNTHTEHVCKEFIYGLDWNLFQRDQLVIGAWDRTIRFYDIAEI
jgi:peroxin-7